MMTITSLLICMMLNAGGVSAVRIEPYETYAQCLRARDEAIAEPAPAGRPAGAQFRFRCISITEEKST